MAVSTPLVFRPSLAQRATALVLFVGSTAVGAREVGHLVAELPGLQRAMALAEAGGSPTWRLWLALGFWLLGALLGGVLVLISLLALLLLERSEVLVDGVGITVEHHALPGFLARRFGAGRLPWKRVRKIERRWGLFTLRGGGEGPPEEGQLVDPTLRFLTVDELERLILTIFERSPNMKFED